MSTNVGLSLGSYAQQFLIRVAMVVSQKVCPENSS